MVAATAKVAGAAALLPGAAAEASGDAAAATPQARRRGWPAARATANRVRIIRGAACDNSLVSKTASALRGANPYLLLTLSAPQLAGVGVSFAGVLAILAHGSLAVLAFLQFNVGDLFLILAMGMWSIYTIGLRWRWSNQGVEQVGASIAGLFVHLMPVFGILLAWVFLDERLALFHIAGIALILSGIGITSRLGRRSATLPAGID